MTQRWLYGWATGYVGVGGASLAVPLYAAALGGDAFLIGLLAATAALAGVPGALLWGRLAGRSHRRRPFILVALGATAVALAVLPLVTGTLLLLLANATLWFVVAAAAPVLNLVMVDGVPQSEWDARIGRLNVYQGYGWVGGLVLGAAWTTLVSGLLGADFARRSLFVVLAAFAVLGFLVVYRFYPDPIQLSDTVFRRGYRRLGRTGWNAPRALRTVGYGPNRIYWGLVTLRPDHLRRFTTPLWRYLAAATLFSVGFAAFWGPMPAYLAGGAYGDGTVFLLFLLANLGSAVYYGRVASLSARFGAGQVQSAALAARVVLFPLVGVVGATAAGLPVVAGAFVVIGVTWALIAVTTTGIVTRLAPEAERGDALGLQTALLGLGGGVGSVVGGALATAVGFLATFGVAGGLVLLGALLALAAGEPTGADAGPAADSL